MNIRVTYHDGRDLEPKGRLCQVQKSLVNVSGLVVVSKGEEHRSQVTYREGPGK